MAEFPLSVLPVGGLGEIGMNCMLIGRRDRWVLVDAGVQFPSSWELGVERRLPDLGMLAAWKDKIEAVVITHGHEDHIGALPWVLPALGEVPVFASSFTRELIRRRLEEHGQWRSNRVTLHEPGVRFEAGPFEVEPIRVTHSLPDCSSLAFRSEDGTILHTGDWKIDEEPMDGESFDRAAFERLGKEGVALLLSDSTNALAPGRTESESAVARALAERVAAWPGRVIVSMFSSNQHRLRGLVAAARATDRKLVFVGRSLSSYLDAAARDGRAPIDPGAVVDADQLPDMDPARTLVVITGSQGEPGSGLYWAARGEHRYLDPGPGDLLLHSARIIPGNEDRTYDMLNHLGQRGVALVYGRATGIHASGHACQEELREMLSLVRPRHFVPLHGEYSFLKRHAEMARKEGIPETTVLRNGERLGIAEHAGRVRAEKQPSAPLEMLYSSGQAVGDRVAMKLSERQRIAWNGVVLVSLTLGQEGKRWKSLDTKVDTRALWLGEGGDLTDELVATAARVPANLPPGTPLAELEEAIRGSIRALCRRRVGKKPDVVVMVHTGASA
ncbi:MAG: ribonuclease J [Deltaproteobacteria bacterium]|nr:ribonuclease J [Deltaproteobacteria bacterium]